MRRSRYGTRQYTKMEMKEAAYQKKRAGKRPFLNYETNGYEGKKSCWIGVRELPTNFVNDKRAYYRSTYLKSEHWKQLKARILALHSSCQRCGSKVFLDVHHLNYRNLYDVRDEDLITLCRKCHKEEHERLLEMRMSPKRHGVPFLRRNNTSANLAIRTNSRSFESRIYCRCFKRNKKTFLFF